MLNYKNTLIVFITTLIIIISADVFFSVHIIFYIIPVLTILSLFVYASASISSQFFSKTYCFSETENKFIALTFDDGPHKLITPDLLELLRKNNIKAAFFCIGKKAENQPELIKQIDLDGHIIGTHSYSHHLLFSLFSAKKIEQELRKTELLIYSIINKKIKWFRPPYGVTNPPIAKAVKAMNYQVIGWSLKSKDTVIKDKQKLLKRLINNIKPGDIVLFHDNQPHIMEVLDKFIKFAVENQYKFVRPDQLLNIEPYE